MTLSKLFLRNAWNRGYCIVGNGLDALGCMSPAIRETSGLHSFLESLGLEGDACECFAHVVELFSGCGIDERRSFFRNVAAGSLNRPAAMFFA